MDVSDKTDRVDRGGARTGARRYPGYLEAATERLSVAHGYRTASHADDAGMRQKGMSKDDAQARTYSELDRLLPTAGNRSDGWLRLPVGLRRRRFRNGLERYPRRLADAASQRLVAGGDQLGIRQPAPSPSPRWQRRRSVQGPITGAEQFRLVLAGNQHPVPSQVRGHQRQGDGPAGR